MKNGASPGRFLPAVLILICGVNEAGATTIPIPNFSFETVSVADGSYSQNNVPGWNFTGFVSTYNPTATEIPGGVPDGANVASVAGGSTLFQTLSAQLQVNTQYTLTAGVGERTDIGAGGYVITLMAGGNVLASDSSQTLVSGSFVTSTLNYFAAAGDVNLGQTLTINIAAQGIGGVNTGQTEFDNFQLTSAPGAPEPASFLLFGSRGCGRGVAAPEAALE